MSDFAKDYIQVNERIIAFYGKYPDGSLQSEIVELNDHLVVMRAYAYRTAEDPRPGIGYSSMEIPGKTSFTRGSEIENTETSAWGRAIAALGFEVKRGIASAEEVRNKSGADEPLKHPTLNDPLVGVAIKQGNQDFELRQSPTGFTLPFRVKEGSKSFIVLAEGKLAEALYVIKDTVLDQRVSVWGNWSEERFTKDGQQRNYRVLHLSRIQTPDGVLPAAA